MTTTTQTPCICRRCGHPWYARVPNPAQCPKCKSYEWQTEKNQPRKEVEQ